MTARVPSVMTTEGSAVKLTLTVLSRWTVRLVTFPTSTPPMRTNWPFVSPDTLEKIALYSVSGANRNLPKTAKSANVKNAQTTMNTLSRRSAPPRLFVTVSTASRHHGAGCAGVGSSGAGVGCSCMGFGTTNGSEPGVGPGSRGAPGGGAGGSLG